MRKEAAEELGFDVSYYSEKNKEKREKEQLGVLNKLINGLSREERVLENNIRLVKNGGIEESFEAICALVKAKNRLKQVKKTKAIATGIAKAQEK